MKQEMYEIDVKGVENVDNRQNRDRVFGEHHLKMYDPN